MSKYTCCDAARDNEGLVDRFDISVTHCPWCCVELPPASASHGESANRPAGDDHGAQLIAVGG